MLVAISRTDAHALAPGRATAAEYGSSALCFHSRAEAVFLHPAAAVGLKRALGHRIALLLCLKNLSLGGKYSVYRTMENQSSAGSQTTAPIKLYCPSRRPSADENEARSESARRNFCSFHHRWCNPRENRKTIVNGGLQRVANVLLSGPFTKVSERPTERFSSRGPKLCFRDQTSATRQDSKHLSGEPCLTGERAFAC